MTVLAISVTGVALCFITGASFSQQRQRKSIEGRPAIAYSHCQGAWQVARTFIEGSKLVTSLGDFAVMQWLQSAGSLILTSGSKIYRWSGSGKPILLMDVKNVLTHMPEDPCEDVLCRFTQDGSKLALLTLYGEVHVIDMTSKRVVLHLTRTDWSKYIHPAPDGFSWHGGLCWSPDGQTLAVTVGPGLAQASSDGSGDARCVLLALDLKVRSLGTGTPICWTDAKHILCLTPVGYAGTIRPDIRGIDGSPTRKSKWLGTELGWDGRYVLLSHKRTLDLVSADLSRKIETIPFPQDHDPGNYWPIYPLVGFRLSSGRGKL